MRYRGALGGLILFVSLVAVPPKAAQADEELQAARRLYLAAVRDEDAQRYDVCLEKFQRVQRVRDTVNVRYHIGRCLEGLGRVASAYAAYAAVREIAGNDPHSVEVLNESMRRASLLVPRIPSLVIDLQEAPTGDVILQVDGEPWDRFGTPFSLDPGRHEVAVLIGGHQAFHTVVCLTEGARETVRIPRKFLIIAPPASWVAKAAPPSERPSKNGMS